MAASSEEEPEAAEKAGKLEAFWKFLRPHTIRGTILGSSVIVIRVLLEHGVPPLSVFRSLLPRALLGVLALLCGNGFIVGINQVYDVDIDKVNKPYLPVAAKELSAFQAWVLVLAMGGLGAYLANSLFGSLIGGLYAFGLVLGTIYSVPPFRFKRFAVAAALIIATVRGFLLNFGVYYATRAALEIPFSWSPHALFITCFVTVFAIIIAITKDLPDTQGDVENKIETFATKFGVSRVALGASVILLLNYASAFYWALGPQKAAFRTQLLLVSHTVFSFVLVRGFKRLKQADFSQEGLIEFYKMIWSLFYSEYLLFPFL